MEPCLYLNISTWQVPVWPIRRLSNLGETNYKKNEETQALAYTQINGIENNLAE